MSNTNKTKRQARRKVTAEDFTPQWLVEEMLSKLPTSVWEENKTFLDPACGNGNMLLCVLIYKLEHNKHDVIKALETVHGTDIMLDNIQETKIRICSLLHKHFNVEITEEIVRILYSNIICTPLDKYPNGSLDFDWDKDVPKIDKRVIEKFTKKMQKNFEKKA